MHKNNANAKKLACRDNFKFFLKSLSRIQFNQIEEIGIMAKVALSLCEMAKVTNSLYEMVEVTISLYEMVELRPTV